MEKFGAQAFYGIAVLIESAARDCRTLVGQDIHSSLSEGDCHKLQDDLSKVSMLYKSIALTTSAKNAEYIKNMMSGTPPIAPFLLSQELGKFQLIIAWEMQEQLFLYVSRERSAYYVEPLKGWEEVIGRFPNTTIDIEESSKCLACDRYAGAVFHAMLVAEIGAVEIGKLIEINDPKVGWPSTIREMTRIVHRTKYADLKPAERKHRALLEQLLPIMESMQQGWRNKISHVENKLVLMTGEFSPHIAEEILIATRSFMRRLATDLPTVQ